MSDKLVQVEHLQQYFPAGGFGKNKKYVQAVDDVSFFINRGETLGLVGESGCGKTTTGRTLLRLYEPTGGRIIYDDKVIFDKEKKIAENMLPYRKKMQIVFQDPYASLDPRMTVGDIVGEPIDIHHLASSKQVINMFEDLQESMNLTYLFIAHDLSVVKHISNRIGVMYLGRMVELADSYELTMHSLHPYTKSLISAIPIADPKQARASKRIALEGDVPSPLNPPSGCRFRTRCPYADEQCAKEVPEFKEVAPGHYAACHHLDKCN